LKFGDDYIRLVGGSDVADGDIGSLVRKGAGDGGADTAGATGDERGLALEF
jgi:hypothetical protein